jgi:lipopolysaccharide cholinephosphotransferase
MKKSMEIETLRKLQLVELEILEQIDAICTKYNISYFLDSGTALGAIRHGGFIPWDDDVDIGMLRDDYERFIRVAEKELAPQYCIQTRETEPNFGKYSAKVRKRGTVFPEKGSEKLAERGIFVDIYPFDYTDNSIRKANRHINNARKILLLLRFIQTDERRTLFVKRVMHRLASLILPEKILENYYLKYCTKYSKTPTSNLTCFSYRMARDNNFIFAFKEMVPSRRIQFEGKNFLIMNNSDYYLSIMYHDYMTLPPQEKRICHVSGDIVF